MAETEFILHSKLTKFQFIFHKILYDIPSRNRICEHAIKIQLDFLFYANLWFLNSCFWNHTSHANSIDSCGAERNLLHQSHPSSGSKFPIQSSQQYEKNEEKTKISIRTLIFISLKSGCRWGISYSSWNDKYTHRDEVLHIHNFI